MLLFVSYVALNSIVYRQTKILLAQSRTLCPSDDNEGTFESSMNERSSVLNPENDKNTGSQLQILTLYDQLLALWNVELSYARSNTQSFAFVHFFVQIVLQNSRLNAYCTNNQSDSSRDVKKADDQIENRIVNRFFIASKCKGHHRVF